MVGVSVIIPTRARPALLQRALASVRSQEAAPLEVIVVDDGTADDVEQVRRAVAASAIGDIRLIANRRARGPSGARNTGAASATGALLAFLDDDDEWLPAYLQQASERFDAGGLNVLCTDLLYKYDDGAERPGKTAPDTLERDAFLVRNPGLIGSNLIISRALYHAIGGFDESVSTLEDMDVGVRLSTRAGVRYARMSQRLVRHYQHSEARLCTRLGTAMRAGVRRFFELHGAHMSDLQRDEFRQRVCALWSVDEHGRVISAAPAAAPTHP